MNTTGIQYSTRRHRRLARPGPEGAIFQPHPPAPRCRPRAWLPGAAGPGPAGGCAAATAAAVTLAPHPAARRPRRALPAAQPGRAAAARGGRARAGGGAEEAVEPEPRPHPAPRPPPRPPPAPPPSSPPPAPGALRLVGSGSVNLEVDPAGQWRRRSGAAWRRGARRSVRSSGSPEPRGGGEGRGGEAAAQTRGRWGASGPPWSVRPRRVCGRRGQGPPAGKTVPRLWLPAARPRAVGGRTPEPRLVQGLRLRKQHFWLRIRRVGTRDSP